MAWLTPGLYFLPLSIKVDDVAHITRVCRHRRVTSKSSGGLLESCDTGMQNSRVDWGRALPYSPKWLLCCAVCADLFSILFYFFRFFFISLALFVLFVYLDIYFFGRPVYRWWWIGEGLYEVQPCTSTSDTVCDACLNQPPHFGNHPEQRNEAHEAQVAANTDYERQCGHRSNNAPSQQRNLLSTLTIADNGKKRTTSGNLIHFLSPTDVAGDASNSGLTAGNSTQENVLPTGSFPSGMFNSLTVSLLYVLLHYSTWYIYILRYLRAADADQLALSLSLARSLARSFPT